ncbi:PASTA domain-containing protein [Sinomonas atrocyanea]|nr:PASTA domain-containing protein [Sinomonas atrocyanea]
MGIAGCGSPQASSTAQSTPSASPGRTMPSVVGKRFGDAQSGLIALGIHFVFRGPDGSQFDNAPDSAKITGTEPAAGVSLPQGTPLVLDVDMTEKDAKAKSDADAAAAAAAASAAAGPPRSIRGNLIAHVGDGLKLQSNDATMVQIKVTGITANARCQSDLFAPTRGQTIVLDMEITTTADLAHDSYPKFTPIFEWKAIASNGTTVNGRIDNINCIAPAKRIPDEIGPSEKVVGQMAFDLPPGAGTLIWLPSGVTSGWEWSYPAG